MNVSPDDPRLTAYALGELDERERAAIEAELERSEVARQTVAEIRETTRWLTEELQKESDVGLSEAQRQAIEENGRRLATNLFPFRSRKLYILSGLAAAACLIIALVLMPPVALKTLRDSRPSAIMRDEAADQMTPSAQKGIGILSEKEATKAATPASAMPRKIIKNGELGLVVKSYEPFFAALHEQVTNAGGYLSQVQTRRGAGAVSSALIVVRVPPERLDPLVVWLSQQGLLGSEKITADDISEQYYDLKTRLENARRFEVRLLEMLRTQTGTLQDLVLVEEKLRQVREQIEQFEGKLRYYDHLIALSTLTLNVSVEERYVSPQAPTFRARAAEMWRDSIQSLKEFSEWVGLVLVAIVPWILPVTLIVIVSWYCLKLVRWLRKRGRTETPRATQA